MFYFTLQRSRGKNENKEQLKGQSPKRSSNKSDVDNKHHEKQRIDENSSMKSRSERCSEKRSKEKEIPNPKVISNENANNIGNKNYEKTIPIEPVNMVTENDDALEEGEIDEQHNDDIKLNNKLESSQPNPSHLSNGIQSNVEISHHIPEIKNEIKEENKTEIPSLGDLLPTKKMEMVMIEEEKTPIVISAIGVNNTDKNIAQNVSDVKTEVIENVKLEENLVPLTEITSLQTDSSPKFDENTLQQKNDTSLEKNDEEIQQTSDPVEHPISDELDNSMLNNVSNKSVKNISTSSKDYLIVDENNETTIYVTRKKKKKKKSL